MVLYKCSAAIHLKYRDSPLSEAALSEEIHVVSDELDEKVVVDPRLPVRFNGSSVPSRGIFEGEFRHDAN